MATMKACSPASLAALSKARFAEERAKKRLDGWFFSKEIARDCAARLADLSAERRAAETLCEIARRLPLTVSTYDIFAGTQSDAFARSYALINPSFRVESFAGYCDPTAVFGDITPEGDITGERIAAVCEYEQTTPYVKALSETYAAVEDETAEVVYFIEQVTGHLIPDMRTVLAKGTGAVRATLAEKIAAETDAQRRDNYIAMDTALSAVEILAARYCALAEEQLKTADAARRAQLCEMTAALRKVPVHGADTLYEAIQSFLLMWQGMCMEQSPNPFAFSVGNADRVFEPYRVREELSQEEAAALFRHFLVFFNVGDRSWAISQNVLISGRDLQGNDLTNTCSYALLDAYFDMNLPQPILSVKLHRNTPQALYRALGRFFFTPGCLTPSLFSDESVFPILHRTGVDEADLPDYAVAGCQEPLIMGRDNGNTTNSWLNLPKILELTLHDGVSAVTGKRIAPAGTPTDAETLLREIRPRFYRNVALYVKKMADAANSATRAVSLLPVPLLSTLMGGVESGYDTRDTVHQGTKYNGSGCLIHGLSVIADSFCAIDCLLRDRPQDSARLLNALRQDFAGEEALREYLLSCPKFGNNIEVVDNEAATVMQTVAGMVAGAKNDLGNPFRPDFSTPSTHLLYGHWVGATPDGRRSRDMLNYGIDPLYGDAQSGLGFRMLSSFRLPFEVCCGGYASHFGIDPQYFNGVDEADKGIAFAERIIKPLFFNPENEGKRISPFYLYVNVTTPDMLRKVLADPKKYAPSGVYIMRIHGTFVNFLDLSPAIQNDIITRLDQKSTALRGAGAAVC